MKFVESHPRQVNGDVITRLETAEQRERDARMNSFNRFSVADLKFLGRRIFKLMTLDCSMVADWTYVRPLDDE